ncbi:MAPK-interacting and spindle-stabilizing protein-like [Macaca thibetana thibetana]|uniref:MAPK-interacting and spindle-stabilizing protein-like n=1 Tax=Macaca thibetana thibetana TaxID=257877 RepID=UPI0021BCAB31|nr:MAPK-interacting and spindle-stabilizing protein-like [Macaca thibetana thibetana]
MACAHPASRGPRAVVPGQMLWAPWYGPGPTPQPSAPSPPGEAETEAAASPKVPEPRAGSTYARQGQHHSLPAARQQDPETSGRFLGPALSLVLQGPAKDQPWGADHTLPPGTISGAEAGGASAQLQGHGIGKAGAWGPAALHRGPLHSRRLTRCHLELSPSGALQVEPPTLGPSPEPLSSLGRWGSPRRAGRNHPTGCCRLSNVCAEELGVPPPECGLRLTRPHR